MIQCITSNLKKQCQVHHDSYELGSIPLQEYPNQPPIYDAPSIYDTDDYGDATKYASRVNERLPWRYPRWTSWYAFKWSSGYDQCYGYHGRRERNTCCAATVEWMDACPATPLHSMWFSPVSLSHPGFWEPKQASSDCCNTGTWSPNKANLTPEDPTQRSYLDAFYDDEYDDSDNTDNSGFFSEPNFKHGVMTPDIWDMFKSDWGQKVQQ